MIGVPRTATRYLKKIITFYSEATFIGKPRLSAMKLERSVSGSKERSTLHDPNFSRWESHKKSITHDLARICKKIDSFASEEVIRTPKKRCKSDNHPKGVKKSFGIDFEFCPYCKAKLYE